MCEIVVNDIFHDLRDENQRLQNELSFERDLNAILENIKTYSIILKNNCICSENIDVFKKLNDFEIDYKILKSKQKSIKSEVKQNVCRELAQIGFDPSFSGKSSGIGLSDIRTVTRSGPKSTKKSETIISLSESILPDQEVDLNCNECHQRFDTELDLVLHVNRNHREVESFVCHECKQVFNTKDLFSEHLLEHQSNSGTTPSSSKPKLRTITDYLRTYRKPNSSETIPIESIKKENNLQYITEMLRPNKSYEQMDSTSDILSNNIKMESNSDSIKCNECENSFESVVAIEAHITQKHPCLVCSKCKKWYYNKDEVFAHLSADHKVVSKPKKQLYVCAPCNYKTLSRGHFSDHLRSQRCQRNHSNTSDTTLNTLDRNMSKICKPKSKVKSIRPSLQPIDSDFKNGYYYCRICNFKLRKREGMVRHQSIHSSDRLFKCDVKGCKKGYNKKNHLKDHKRRAHKNAVQFSLLKELNENIRSSSKLDFSHESKDISNEDQTNGELHDSTGSQQQIKLEVISDSDDESIILKSSAERIINSTQKQSTELKDKSYSCKKCHFTAMTKIFLALHEMQEHPEMRPHKCQVDGCGKSFAISKNLNRHIREVHKIGIQKKPLVNSHKNSNTSSNTRLFECNVCNYKTVVESLLRRHLTSHSPDKPFKCDVEGCEYSARRKDILKAHQKRVHKKGIPTFVCNYPKCKRGFDSPLLLRQHMNCHKNRFVCRWEGCEFRTDTFAKLNEHRRTANHMKSEIETN